jgi:acetate kinase
MRVLVVNAGSSSLKLRLVDEADVVAGRADLPAIGDVTPDDITRALAELGPCDAVGHRVVHGGEDFREPVVVDPGVRQRLGALTDLAPLHQPKSLAGIEAVRSGLPGVPEVACFDTAFHATLPEAAATYAVPAAWRRTYGLRRYGFHGLSHAYAARRVAQFVRAPRLVVCHLGAGASLCAVRDGRSVDTTMGFTPLEGLVMATRSGDVDPGMLLWLAERTDLTVTEISRALEHESGLLALAGTADMRKVVAEAERGEPRAVLALDVYIHRLRAGVAAMAASLGGLDVLVFTGGVGEHAAEVRRRAAAGLAFLGVAVDAGANREVAPDAEITGRDASARTFVIAAREDLEIAAGVRAVLS